MSIQTRTISLNGKTVRYLEGGTTDNAPILLLHGALGDATFHWSRLMPILTEKYYVVAPDLPGFGDSEKLHPLNYMTLVAWVTDLLATLDMQQVVIIGNSLGGLVARLFAANTPHKVPALVLINGGVLPGKAAGGAKVMARIPGISDMIFGMFSRQGVGRREALDWVVANHEDTEILTDEMVATAAANVPALVDVMKMQVLSPIPDKRVPTLPTLLLWGAQDTLSPVSAGEKVHNAIPGSVFQQIEGTKHAPHIEEPDVVAFQIESYLNDLNRPKPSAKGNVGKLGD
jgi:pimeloyl-ACP methyl ester carboxylesterase